jgi:GNAT superfamily N-acetyltransferase
MELTFTSPFEAKPGIISWFLNHCYAELVETEPEIWEAEKANWEVSDRNVFENPSTIGACTFLSWYGPAIVGFFSVDPRPRPAYGVIGHNCILPEYRRKGFGRQQVGEALRGLTRRGIRQARVSTNDHPFFLPAQRIYTACGFVEIERTPWVVTKNKVLFITKKSLDNRARDGFSPSLTAPPRMFTSHVVV